MSVLNHYDSFFLVCVCVCTEHMPNVIMMMTMSTISASSVYDCVSSKQSFFRHKLKRNHLRLNHLACIIFSTTKLPNWKKTLTHLRSLTWRYFSFPKQNYPIEKNTHPFKIIWLEDIFLSKTKLPNWKKHSPT